MNLDQLRAVPETAAVMASIAALDGVQSYPAPTQVAALALLFTEMCDGCGLDVSELIDQSRRRVTAALNHDGLTQRKEAAALRAYVKGELA